MAVPTISLQELKDIIDNHKKYVLIDVRDCEERRFRISRSRGLNIPRGYEQNVYLAFFSLSPAKFLNYLCKGCSEMVY